MSDTPPLNTDATYIYLSFSQLQDICLVHLISGMDEDGAENAPDAAVSTAITGYTEWVSEGSAIITIGWDWEMLFGDNCVGLRRVSQPSSNLMLRSPAGLDLGPVKTNILLEMVIDDFNWQAETLQYINVRYNMSRIPQVANSLLLQLQGLLPPNEN